MRHQTILIFHGIGTPRPDLPADELPYWIARDFFDEIVTFVASRRAQRPVLITFDDGNASDLQAAEQLKSHGLDGKFFILTDRLGQPHYLSPDDARDLDRNGFEVGLHGRGHVDWRSASNIELDAETIEARAVLADALDKPVTSAAIPFGAYNRRVIAHLRRQNFDCIYTSDAGPAQTDGWLKRRTTVMAHHRIDDIAALIDDRAGSAARLRRTIVPIVKRWR